MNKISSQNTLHLGILLSGRGSNLRAIHEACIHQQIPARIALVISDNPHALGVIYAREHCIATYVVDFVQLIEKYEQYSLARKTFEKDVHKKLIEARAQLVCLAGFMRILSTDFLALWPDRVINIHPSFLPALKGLDTHKRALEQNLSQHGCTVHYVSKELDNGRIILQEAIFVQRNDTETSLSSRVLEAEHRIYPKAIGLLATKILSLPIL
jgi:phosphoribosylglycinamide formyltransferase-1